MLTVDSPSDASSSRNVTETQSISRRMISFINCLLRNRASLSVVDAKHSFMIRMLLGVAR